MFDEFNRESEPAPENANWQGWTPPWMSGEGQDGPRGPFGPGPQFGGPRGPFGPRGWHGHHHGPFGHRHGWKHGGWGWQGPRGPFGPGFGPGRFWNVPEELLALRAEAAEVARLFAIASRGAFENKERLSQLRAMLERTHKELTDMIYGSSQGQTPGQGESGSGPADIGQA
ncbi:MAG TPA: hypothetical protein VFA09_05290 [Ktedonobacteraceae bacterium]|nr:hypothetical protein [Ktedonobacteraceae bacterium]